MIEYEPSLPGALASLCPNGIWTASLTGDFDIDWENLDWISGDKPDKAAVRAEITRLEERRAEYEAWVEQQAANAQAEYERTEYRRLRSPEYPPIGDQLDALYHAGLFPEEMAAKIQAVKEKYPKPE